MSATVDTPNPQTQPEGERKHGNMPLDMVTSYNFYQLDPAFRHLPDEARRQATEEFSALVEKYQAEFWIRSYSTFGLREDADFFFWNVAKEVEPIQQFCTAMAKTMLGRYLRHTHNYVAVSRESQYTKDHVNPPMPDMSDAKYLFVYPFIKNRDWYQLPFPERMRIMKQHIDVGHEYPDIAINTAYSFGIDDQDFVVSFDGNSLQDFVQLVMKLRETESSKFTVRDVPAFIGIKKSIRETLETLGL